ncbi:MAG TPA: CHAP domain-containing protein, partial [Coleofasciculaceae cyanobacterium]
MNTKRLRSALTAATKKPLLLASSTALLLGTLSTTFLLTSTESAAQSVRWCWCTDYVAKKFGLTWDFPHAKDWNDGYLQRNGFRQVGVQVGAIVVMEKTFPGADRTYGHVGVVEGVNSNGIITVRGANQLGSQGSDSGCNNVTVVNFGTSVNNRSDVSFWVRGNTSPVSGFKTYFVGDYALNTNNYFSRIDGFPIMSSWRRNDSDPDQQFERLQGNRVQDKLLKHKSTGACLNAHYLYNGAQMNVWRPCSASDPDQ